MRPYVIMLVLCKAFLCLPTWADADNSPEREYRVKAAYLYNLLKFIEWPRSKDNLETPLNVCYFDNHQINKEIKGIAERKVNNQSIVLTALSARQKIPKDCNLLFVTSNNSDDGIFSQISDQLMPTLTVGEDDSFVHGLGMVALVRENNRIKLKINLKHTKKKRFKISSKLLQIAEIIE